MIDILVATTNAGKLLEFKFMLKGKGFNVLSLKDFPSIETPLEPYETFEENAKIKADFYFKHFKIPVIVEDSGFCVEKLEGLPGVHSAEWGKNGDFSDGIKKLYKMLNSASSKAFFVSVIIFKSEQKEILTRGEVKGKIAKQPKGSNGFGFDSCFIPFSWSFKSKTFGEMKVEEKSKFSHRNIALKKLMKII